MSKDARAAIAALTSVTSPSLVPEIRLHLLPDESSFELLRYQSEMVLRVPTPYWAIAWPGGQALARYALDHPTEFRDRSVLDLGTGSGIAAVAARLAGASRVVAVDRDAAALEAAALNACLNNVFIELRQADFEAATTLAADLVLAGDLWYERFDARRATAVLRRQAKAGARVLCGDHGRAHFPRSRTSLLAAYELTPAEGFEPTRSVTAKVWRMLQ